jgi:hypothetical protein
VITRRAHAKHRGNQRCLAGAPGISGLRHAVADIAGDQRRRLAGIELLLQVVNMGLRRR